MIPGSFLAALGNLNGPGRYLHWSIFTVSEANLVLIAVMVVIFGAALRASLPRTPEGGAPRRPRWTTPAATVSAPGPVGTVGSDMGDDVRRRHVDLPAPAPGPEAAPPRQAPARPPARLRRLVDLRVRRGHPGRPRSGDRLGLRHRPGRARTGGTPMRSGISSTASICGASRRSWPSWSSTSGASSGWPPGEADGPSPGSPGSSPSWRRSSSASPATCPSRTSTPSGSRPAARTPSTPSE